MVGKYAAKLTSLSKKQGSIIRNPKKLGKDLYDSPKIQIFRFPHIKFRWYSQRARRPSGVHLCTLLDQPLPQGARLARQAAATVAADGDDVVPLWEENFLSKDI